MLARTPPELLLDLDWPQAALPLALRDRRLPRAAMDFETRSIKDVKRVGAWLYSKHHSTQILCLSYVLPGMDPRKPKLWHRAHPELGIEETPRPTDLIDYIVGGGIVEAHNAFFEWCIWNHVGTTQHEWPELPLEQMRCSAAKAAAHSLPRNLEGAIDALNLPVRKDEWGKIFIAKYCKPKRLTKAEKDLWGADAIIFQEDEADLRRGWEYCRQDVRSENRLSESLPDLSPMEQQIWLITQRMNARGALLDIELCNAALDLTTKAKRKLNAELHKITGIEAGSKRAAIKKWLIDNESFEIPDTKAKTVEWYLDRAPKGTLTPRSRRVLEIIKEVNRTSPKKYKRMLECTDAEGRARDLLVYCGAERTGRFAGRGIQIQNLPKGRWTFPLSKQDKPHAMDFACDDVKSRDFEWCELVHGDVMNLIVSCLRGAIISSPGRDLVTADYSAIEARVVLWMAGADAALEVFRKGGDIYCDMASGVYGREITKATVQPINATGATERDFGKVAILGLGYGMGWLKFLLTLRTYNIYLTRDEVLRMMGAKRLKKYEAIVRKKLFPDPADYDDEKKFKTASREAVLNRRRLTEEREAPENVIHELALCKYTVDTYRTRYPEVPQLWKDMEAAMIRAVRTRKPIKCGVVTWYVKGRFLKCRLPSGRTLNYCDPEIKMARTSWGELRPSLRFMGIDQKTKRWTRQGTYGGKVCIEEGMEVLTNNGWVPIEQILPTDFLWDGKYWVTHGGVVWNDTTKIMRCDDIGMTPEHEILTDKGWKHASSGDQYFREDVWLPNGYRLCGQRWQEVALDRSLCLWRDKNLSGDRIAERQNQIMRLQAGRLDFASADYARPFQSSDFRGLEKYDSTLPESEASRLYELWRTWNHGFPSMGVFQQLRERYARNLEKRIGVRAHKQRQRLLQTELRLGNSQATSAEPAYNDSNPRYVTRSLCRQTRHIAVNRSMAVQARVFDIVNAGPRNRFVVRNKNQTRCLIVHNCENADQAISRDIMGYAMLQLDEDARFDLVLSVHDELGAEADHLDGDTADAETKEFEALMTAGLTAAFAGCPISAESKRYRRYRK